MWGSAGALSHLAVAAAGHLVQSNWGPLHRSPPASPCTQGRWPQAPHPMRFGEIRVDREQGAKELRPRGRGRMAMHHVRSQCVLSPWDESTAPGCPSKHEQLALRRQLASGYPLCTLGRMALTTPHDPPSRRGRNRPELSAVTQRHPQRPACSSTDLAWTQHPAHLPGFSPGNWGWVFFEHS